MRPERHSTTAYQTFLEEEFVPWLAEQEGERRHVFGRSWRRAAPALFAALAVFLLMLVFQTPPLVLAAALVVPSCLIWALFRFDLAFFWEERFQKAFWARIFGYFGLDSVDPPSMGLFNDFYFFALPPGGRAYEICIHGRGEFQGVACDIMLGRHATSGRSPYGGRTASAGSLFVRLAYPKPFSGVTSVLPDYGSAVNLVRQRPYAEKGGVARVRLENPDFEALFEVYSTDQVEARYLLTPRFMERVMDLRKRFGHELRMAFGNGGLYLLLESEFPYFTEGKAVDDPCVLTGLHALGADIMRVGDAIGALKLDVETKV
ncbi:MAG: DUF3137 domain-containing protein [Parvibaculum sp.]